ncbi:phosphate/phosphite/phosphonate ABC transporter substrate-binding protein [Microbacter sp. GSS18]|nr:phosphate/phosphite/phosphonate ABC transporter substrate-binding protein [Microbacter sp. GSS18]
MRTSLRALPVLAAAVLLIAGCSASPNAREGSDSDGAAPEELVFGLVPTDNSQDLEASTQALANAIEESTGIPVEIQVVSSNAGLIEAQVAERVDIATYGPFAYYLAADVADITPIGMDQLSPDPESSVVFSYAVAPAGTDITSLEDLGGRDICFTDPGSTTGYLAGAAGLVEAGIDPETDVNAIFTGAHDVAVTQMLAGDCDVAFTASTFIDLLFPASGLIEEGETEVVWKSPGIAGTAQTVGNWLPEEVRSQIAQALTGYNAVTAAEAGFCEGEEQPAPDNWGPDYAGQDSCRWSGTGAFAYAPADASDYDFINDICAATQAEVCRAE